MKNKLKLLLLFLIPFLFSCEKYDEPEIRIHNKIDCISADYDTLNLVKIQHQIDTKGLIILHDYQSGKYHVKDLYFNHTIDCNWDRLKEPRKTYMVLWYVVANDTIKKRLESMETQINIGNNYIKYKL